MSHNSLEWEAFEYHFRKKSTDWYWAVWIIAVFGATISILFHNLILAILILVGAFALSIYAARPPEKIHYEVNRRGVIIGTYFYPYEVLETFTLDEYCIGGTKLLIKSKKLLVPLLSLPLQNIDSYALKDFLEKFLPYQTFHEPLWEKLLAYLGI